MFLDDNLLILILIAFGICLTMDRITLIYAGIALDLLNGLWELLLRFGVTSKKLTISQLELIYISNPIYGGARGVMVIVIGNGHSDKSSNPGRDWLHFT